MLNCPPYPPTQPQNWQCSHSSSLYQFFIPSQNSLFKVQVWNGGGDSSNKDDLRNSGSQTASRPQTFLRPVTMTTAPLPPLHMPVRQAAPPFSPNTHFPPPPLVFSAVSGRPPQQAAHAEAQDKGTKRAFVPPMTPQPLHIQGANAAPTQSKTLCPLLVHQNAHVQLL